MTSCNYEENNWQRLNSTQGFENTQRLIHYSHLLWLAKMSNDGKEAAKNENKP